MELSQVLSWIGFINGMLIGVPQVVKTIKTKSARDLSATTFYLILITCISFLVRAVSIQEITFIFYYSFVICTCLLQLFLIWKFKLRNTAVIETTGLCQPRENQAQWLEEQVQRRIAALQARIEELAAYDWTVAHDLKNPLALVIGYAQILEEFGPTMPTEELQECLHSLTQSACKVRTIIDELLLASAVGSMEVEMRPLDTASIVMEAQQRLALMIAAHRAKIIMPESWPVALGYEPWVEEVWANYLSNAIKYGGQPPYVELGATEQGDGKVRFWVRDNGSGIPPGKQDRLFTSFTRLDPERTRGHGLGLSIVRRIVEKLGGQVGVESDGLPGRGSVFTFSLPGTSS